MQLNAQQLRAVKHIQGPLLVIAGAGSGKTRVITEKIRYLVSECGVRPHNILALTFTNKAAREMKERIQSSVTNKVQTRGLKISTFHTFGLNFIKKEMLQLGFKKGFSLLDDQDSRMIVRELLFQGSSPDPAALEQALAKISDWKSRLIDPTQALSYVENDQEQHWALIYAHYQRQIKAYNAIDFDDLIGLPTQLLSQSEEVRLRWQSKIHYLLVDEYQDTNVSQYQLIKLIVGTREKFTMVGDDDQSIYAWRGAAPENLRQLGCDYKALSVIKLEQNYRSTGSILSAANAVIANNEHLYEKKLWSTLGPGDSIDIWECRSEHDEVERVTQDILSKKLRLGKSFGDFAVLYRSNHQSRLLEMSLRGLQIPYFVSGGTSFFSRTEIKDIVCYLRLILNETDDTALLRIINTPRREIGPVALEQLGAYATERDVSLMQAMSEIGFESHTSPPALRRFRRFADWLDALRRKMFQSSVRSGVEMLLSDLDYLDWIQLQSSSPKVAEKRWENVMSLVEMLHQMAESELADGAENDDVLERVLNKLILRDMLDQQAENQRQDQVQLMTLHAAKGLEFPYTYLIGMEEDILPHRNSLDDHMLQEERRLFYVGLTRAQQNLTLSYASSRKQYGEQTSCLPSRFLDELPADVIQWHRIGEKRSRAQQVQTANNHLASIRALLD